MKTPTKQLTWPLVPQYWASQWLSSKEPTCQCRRYKRYRFDPWVGKITCRRAWQPTPIFLLGKSHGQMSLVGYSPWGPKELDTTEQLNPYTYKDPVSWKS